MKARLLAAIEAAEVEEIAAQLDRLWASGGFRVRRAPRAGLVMVTVCDPFETPFHLGEVLVSEAEVVCDGRAGYGAVCGDAPEKALLLAAVEAAERGGRTDVLGGLAALVGGLEKKCAAARACTAGLAAATEVRFDSMKKETVDFGSLGD